MTEVPPELVDAIHLLAEEWFEGQTADLSPEQLPPRDELEDDIAEFTDDVVERILPAFQATDCQRDGHPNDPANRAALSRLRNDYVGLEKTTPIFTALALSKHDEPPFSAGWPLCAIRLIAEIWLPQVRRG